MSRRLLGYVVRLPDGTRSPRTPKPISLANVVLPWCSGRTAEPDVIVPVFAVRRPKAADEPKPAPVVAGERYACLLTRGPVSVFVAVADVGDIGSREAAERSAAQSHLPEEQPEVVRILPDGAHEAAIAQAREDVLSVVRRVLTADGAYEKPLGTLRDEIVGRVNGGES